MQRYLVTQRIEAPDGWAVWDIGRLNYVLRGGTKTVATEYAAMREKSAPPGEPKNKLVKIPGVGACIWDGAHMRFVGSTDWNFAWTMPHGGEVHISGALSSTQQAAVRRTVERLRA